jgi:dextranase
VSRFDVDRDPGGVGENVRRFHLNAVQFYDWMYRHANLLPPADDFDDALGRRLSLAAVRRLIDAVSAAGSLPLAYAAVYAVGKEAWPQWRDAGLYRADGSPWMLGDFLWNVDPSNRRWVTHFVDELRSTRELGFAGFHLDQYGSPKWALRADGTRVDLADAFPALLERIAAALPHAQLVFNNVNDFPTWATASAPTALTYIEVWPPHTGLRDLATLVAKARTYAPGKPVVLAAYLSCYEDDERRALQAEKLQLATVFSSGGTVLLHGEENAVLTDPYYVRHASISAETQDDARRYFDFLVRYGDLLLDPDAVDVTGSHLGGENQEVRIEAPVRVAVEPEPGALWARVIRAGGGLLVHLIDLSGQDDDRWDAPKLPAEPLRGVRVSILRRNSTAPAVLAADPETRPALTPLAVETAERYDVVEVPPFSTWSLLQVREAPA